MIPTSQIPKLFDRIDEDGSGEIEFNEFLAWRLNYAEYDEVEAAQPRRKGFQGLVDATKIILCKWRNK